MATTISISEKTRDKIKEFGLKGETYDDIINKLCEQASSNILRNFLYEDNGDYMKIDDAIKRAKDEWK